MVNFIHMLTSISVIDALHQKGNFMLTYDLSRRGTLPIYEFLYRCIKEDICSGKISAEEKLPSKRMLAQHLQISVITVENAYSQLLLEGYIYSVEKRGYFASKELVSPTNTNTSAPPSPVQSPEEQPVHYIDLNNNTPCPEMFPFSVWSKGMRQILSESATYLLEKTPCGGALPLRQAICHHLLHFSGMEVTPEQIIVGAGTEYLYVLLLQLLGTEKIYGLEDPGYQKISHVYENGGATCVFLPLDEKGLSATALKQSTVDVLHISPTHHFPTGITMPVTRRRQLLQWASRKTGRYIIEDDYDSEFRFTGMPIPTLQSIDDAERVIYMNTFSKTMAPGIRISYMVLPPHLLERYYTEFQFYTCPVSSFEQHALAEFIQSGAFEKHLNRMRIYYRKQRKLVMETIRRVFPEKSGYDIFEPHAGLHFLLELHTPLRSEEICEKMLKKGIKISCLSEYYRNWQETSPFPKIIINYTNLDIGQLQHALKLLWAICQMPGKTE